MATAQRTTRASEAADVPFHYLPPPLSQRDPTTEVKNGTQVFFPRSTREQRDKMSSMENSLPNAGPGAYDVVKGIEALSTKPKIVKTGPFALAERPTARPDKSIATSAGPGA
jgi:Holliday junction resolvase RusA-like endonuclease